MNNLTIPSYKTCRRCKYIKALSDFWKDKSRQDGHAAICIECGKALNQENVERRRDQPKHAPEQKRCPTCQAVKTSEGFYKNKTTPDGLTTQCRACISAHQSTPHWKALRKKHKRKAYIKSNGRPTRNAWYRRKYGITLQEYEAMQAAQNNVCAICNRPQVEGFSLAVDHNHTTGKVRDLLCNFCNHALGSFQESVEILQAAIDYLKRHS